MGASNVLAAYTMYAGKVPATSMQLLVYMAAVSKDTDKRPWFGQGHQALAQHALGRPAPATGADVKAVERALAPLARVGAITTDRRAAVRSDGANTARYRLHLDPTDAPRISGDVTPPPAPYVWTDIDGEDPPRPPENGADVPRKVDARPPKNVRTPPEKRGTEETRGKKRSDKTQENSLALDADVTVPRARASPTTPPKCSAHGLDSGTRSDGQPNCTLCRNVARIAAANGTDPPPPLRLVQGGAA